MKRGVKEITIDRLFVCMICGGITEHYTRVCAYCEDPNGGDASDD